MKTIKEIIDELIGIKDNVTDRIEEEIYNNLNYDKEYKDLNTAEIERINKYRKNIYYIYEAISILDIIKEEK